MNEGGKNYIMCALRHYKSGSVLGKMEVFSLFFAIHNTVPYTGRIKWDIGRRRRGNVVPFYGVSFSLPLLFDPPGLRTKKKGNFHNIPMPPPPPRSLLSYPSCCSFILSRTLYRRYCPQRRNSLLLSLSRTHTYSPHTTLLNFPL